MHDKYSAFPSSVFEYVSNRLRNIFDDPFYFSSKFETLAGGAKRKKLNSSAEKYCLAVGLNEIWPSGRTDEIGVLVKEQATIHKLIRSLKPKTVLELGSGFSTLTIAHALKMNGHGILYSVDANKEWLYNTDQKIPKELRPFIRLQYSAANAVSINGQLCSLYQSLPNISPEFIYVDAPHGKDVDGDVNGLSFEMEGTVRKPIAADVLLYESTSGRDFFILVDGRAANVQFLRRNLSLRYRFYQSPLSKQSYFKKL